MLTISGVARVFVTKRSLLHTLGDFPKAWRLLLEHIEKLSLSATQEVFLKVIFVFLSLFVQVSLAALKAFHEMVVSGEEKAEGPGVEETRSSIQSCYVVIKNTFGMSAYLSIQVGHRMANLAVNWPASHQT